MNLQITARKMQLKIAAPLSATRNRRNIPNLQVDRTSDSLLDRLRSSNIFVGWRAELKNNLQLIAALLEEEKTNNPIVAALNQGATTKLRDLSPVYINKLKASKPAEAFVWHLYNDLKKIVEDLADMPESMPEALHVYLFSNDQAEKDIVKKALTDPKLNKEAKHFLKKIIPLKTRLYKYNNMLEEFLNKKDGLYNLVALSLNEGYSEFVFEDGKTVAKSYNWNPRKKIEQQKSANSFGLRVVDIYNLINKTYNVVNHFYEEASLIPGETAVFSKIFTKPLETITGNSTYKYIEPAPKTVNELTNAFGKFTSVLSPIIGKEITWDQYSDLLKDTTTRDIVETIIRSQERQSSIGREYNAPVNRELSPEDIIKLRKVLSLGVSDITVTPDRFSDRSSAREVVDVATSMFMQGRESEARQYIQSNKQINEMAQLSPEAKRELQSLIKKDISDLEYAKSKGTLQANELNQLEELKTSLKVLRTLILKDLSQSGTEIIPNFEKSVQQQSVVEVKEFEDKERGYKTSIEILSDKYKDMLPNDLESTLKDKSREKLSQILSDLTKVEDNGRKQKYLTADQIRNVDKLKIIVRKALMDLINKENNRTQFQR